MSKKNTKKLKKKQKQLDTKSNKLKKVKFENE